VQAARSLENATRWINEAFEEAFHDIRQRVEAAYFGELTKPFSGAYLVVVSLVVAACRLEPDHRRRILGQ
jgi:hypothetical protein